MIYLAYTCMKNLKTLLLVGLLALPTAAGATVAVAPQPAPVVTQAALPAPLTDEQMDQAQGKFAIAVPEIAIGALAATAYVASKVGNTQLADAASSAADNIKDGVNRAVSAVGDWASNTFDSAKKSKQSGKEASTDTPSWSKGMTGEGNTHREQAKSITDQRFGEGNWSGGAGSDYNKIKKNLERKGK